MDSMPFNYLYRSLKNNLILLHLTTYIALLFLSTFNVQRLQAGEPVPTQIRNSVVKINVISQIPNYTVPWNLGRITRESGTGFLISDKQILTNAHVSSNARFISIEKEGDSRKYEAKVKFIAHDCDLSILEVLDESFFDGLTSLSFGGVPSLNSTVTVMGYPIGGNRLSVTRGVVSRIDYQVYAHSSADSHLAIQIDAAINSGNSGGPVLQNNIVVGVAFQGYSGNVAQNVGYMIPVPVIKRFLTDAADGQYDHYVDLGLYSFPLINGAYRRAVGLEPNDYGVMVSGVISAGASASILKAGDVLLSIEDLPIDSNGYVEMDGRRILMSEVVERKFRGDKVRIKILRERKEMEVIISLNTPWPYLTHARRHDIKPRFVIVGGLLFQPLSFDFINANDIKNIDILYQYSFFLENELYLDRPEIVVLSKILPDPINAYLSSFVNSIVHKINDKEIKTLEDVSTAFKEPVEHYVIQLMGKNRPIVLERSEVIKARKRILRRYGVLKEEYLGDSIVPDHWSLSSTKKMKSP
jgi:S1-C subfamily serine protease